MLQVAYRFKKHNKRGDMHSNDDSFKPNLLNTLDDVQRTFYYEHPQIKYV